LVLCHTEAYHLNLSVEGIVVNQSDAAERTRCRGLAEQGQMLECKA